MATRRSRSTVGTGGGRPPPVTRWMWKRSHGRTSEAPPDERGGYRYVRPTATASHLDSTHLAHLRSPRRGSLLRTDSGRSALVAGNRSSCPCGGCRSPASPSAARGGRAATPPRHPAQEHQL